MSKDKYKYANQWLEQSNSQWIVIRSDVFDIIKELPDKSVDLIITDLPYESLNKHRDSKKRIKKYKRDKRNGNLEGTRIPRLKEWFDVIPNNRIPELLNEFYRILVDNSHMYLFCDDETSDVIVNCAKDMTEERGQKNSFKVWKRIVWDKVVRGMGYHYANQHEFILFMEKGKRKLNNLSYTSVQKYKRIARPLRATQKPEDLIDVFVLNSSDLDDLVFDPFCGCGGVGISAVRNGREFLGFDIDKNAVSISRKRINNLGE